MDIYFLLFQINESDLKGCLLKGVTMRTTTKLRKMITSGETVLIPGVYDGLSARIAQAAGASLL